MNEIRRTLLYRHGRLQLIEGRIARSPVEDVAYFLLSCSDEEFLDFIEYIFKVRCLSHVCTDENILVAELNELLASENMAYELTQIAKEEVVEPVYEYPYLGKETEVIKVTSYPKIIRKDSQVIHSTTTMPALQLLSEPKYKMANQEYLDALEDYRKGDYGDCLTKCCSAFESVMKIICENKRWTYKQTDTASSLINTIISKSGLDAYFEQPLLIIAILRNRLSKSHGAGINPKNVSPNIAQYALNSTAAAILLLVKEIK